MGQPNPPGDIPLFEGLGTEWNDIVSGFPEDKRAELAPLLKARVDQFTPLKQWEQFQKNGIAPQQVETALNLFNIVESDPRQVYETIGRHLGITPQEAKAAVKELKEEAPAAASGEDPRIATMESQLKILSELALRERQQTIQGNFEQQAEAQLDRELSELKNKFGDDVDEGEIIMRMMHLDMTAAQAHEDYMNKVGEIRKNRPSPMLLGSGGVVPRRAIDPTKLDNRGTKDLVAQMMQRALDEDKS